MSVSAVAAGRLVGISHSHANLVAVVVGRCSRLLLLLADRQTPQRCVRTPLGRGALCMQNGARVSTRVNPEALLSYFVL